MKPSLLTLFLIFTVLALGACSSNTERIDYKKDAAKGRPLDVPPDLVPPRADGKYVVPDGGKETSATYSEYTRAGSIQAPACACPQAASQPAAAQALPQVATQPAVQPAPVATVPPKLLDKPDGSNSILIAEPFDRCWLKVSQAVDRVVADKDRSKGLLYLKDGNQVSVQGRAAEGGKAETCEVSAASASGAVTKDTKSLIDALYKILSK